MSLSHEEVLAENIEVALQVYHEAVDYNPDIRTTVGTVLDVMNDFIHSGVPVITTQVVLNEGDWVTVQTYGAGELEAGL